MLPLLEKFKISTISVSKKQIFCNWLCPLLGASIQTLKSIQFSLPIIFNDNRNETLSNMFNINDFKFFEFTYSRSIVDIAKNLSQNYNNQPIFIIFLQNFQNFILKNFKIIVNSFKQAQLFSFLLQDVGYFLDEK